MSVPSGLRIGVYEVVAKLGEGGMGEVYRGRDTRLDREVALKVLPDEFAADPERLARFEREAKTLASLNHPHIAQIYGFEQSGAISALVMELVEGEDLSQRLARGSIPVDDALPIACQIAEALEAAHDAGIIHRDLKPANVKVRPDGTVKVLDFGLAKAVDQGSGIGERESAQLANSPTITTPAMTMHGMILGTAAYMAPEQAKGKVVDRRADIWAFGCVLYEMLTGQRTFAGEDVSDTLVSVLRDDPQWAALPPDTPAHVRALLRRCLQKDPQKRLPHIGSARLELTEGASVEPLAPPPLPRGKTWVAAAATGVVLGAAAVGLLLFVNRRAAVPPPAQTQVRFTIEPPSGYFLTGASNVPRFAVSPDGTMVAYQLADRAGAQLWVRVLDTLDAQPLPATTGGPSGISSQMPFWSPDGTYLAYFDEDARQLKRIHRQSGAVQTLATIPGNQLSGTWNDDNVILMSGLATNGVQRVPAGGGPPVQVTSLDSATGEISHLWPDFLPDGKHFVYHVRRANDPALYVHVASIEGGPAKRLFESPAAARVAWPNRLLFVRDGALLAQPFDLGRLELSGEPVVIANDVSFTPAGRMGVSASRSGVLVVATSNLGDQPQQTVWVDRTGRELAPAPPTVIVGYGGVRLSPDGSHLIYGRAAATQDDGRTANQAWIQDLARGIESRMSNDLVTAGPPPAFTRDGASVVFTRPGIPSVMVRQAISGAAPAQSILRMASGRFAQPLDVSRDGTVLIAESEHPRIGLFTGLAALPPGAENAVPFIAALTGVSGAAFSPDGRWVAYSTGSLLERQVFIQPFPDASAGKWPVSGAGGGHPRWRADGRELYFVDLLGRLVAVDVSLSPRVEIGPPKPLGIQVSALRIANPYDVSADGRRFVVLRERSQATGQVKLIVTVDWQRPVAALK